MVDPPREEPAEPQQPPAARPARRTLVTTLVVLGSIFACASIAALWVNRQLLNTGNWASSSSQMLESPAIRGVVAGYLVDQAYASFDVTGELRRALPTQAKPLAAPAAGGLRNLAQQGVELLLRRPAVQALWEDANRVAHRRLLQVVGGGSGGVSTRNGTVTLDLGLLLQRTANDVGLGEAVAQHLPPGTAQITVLRSKQLGTVQKAARALRTLPVLLLALTLLCYGLALVLAGRRRETLRTIGIGLVAAGIVALVARPIVGNAVVDALATTAATRPAVHDVWWIETSQLRLAAEASIVYGLLALLAAWLAGPARAARAARAWAAPYLRDPRYAWGGLAVLVLVLVAWRPTPATRNALTLLLLVALLALGLEALRRQTASELPRATAADAAARRRAWAEGAWASVSGTAGRLRDRVAAIERGPSAPPAAPSAAPGPVATIPPEQVRALARLEVLERLGRLRESGVLDEREFQAEKRALLGGS